jgi:hypothetical protein
MLAPLLDELLDELLEELELLELEARPELDELEELLDEELLEEELLEDELLPSAEHPLIKAVSKRQARDTRRLFFVLLSNIIVPIKCFKRETSVGRQNHG